MIRSLLAVFLLFCSLAAADPPDVQVEAHSATCAAPACDVPSPAHDVLSPDLDRAADLDQNLANGGRALPRLRARP